MSECILVADDDREIVKAIAILLEREGYKVLRAYDGLEALDLLAQNQVQLILMDVMMPVMDGIAATKAIRAMDRADAKTIPIIAMTANAFEEDAKRCLVAGMTAHLAKPFQIEDVEKTIVECCGK